MKKQHKTYQFTLVLKNVDEYTPKLEDSLYEVGCDDALINFRNGTVYLDFDREALSLEQAVTSAIKDVESASIGATISHVAPEDLVTESEVAKRLEIRRQAVSLWIKGARRKSFPKPVMKLADKSPLWKWREIAEWLYKNKLIKGEERVLDAIFLENVNAVLEERDSKTRKYRYELLKKLESHASYKIDYNSLESNLDKQNNQNHFPIPDKLSHTYARAASPKLTTAKSKLRIKASKKIHSKSKS